MIEFNGTITCDAKKMFEKIWMKGMGLSLLFAFVIFATLPIYFGITEDSWYLIVAGAMAIAFSLCYLVAFLTREKMATKSLLNRLVIDFEEETITAYHSGIEVVRMLEEIESIEDHGEWYNFVFVPERKVKFIVAQKDLISKGTIEKFEELFREVIVRV